MVHGLWGSGLKRLRLREAGHRTYPTRMWNAQHDALVTDVSPTDTLGDVPTTCEEIERSDPRRRLRVSQESELGRRTCHSRRHAAMCRLECLKSGEAIPCGDFLDHDPYRC